MTSEQSRLNNRAVIDQYDEYVMPIWKSLDARIKQAQDCTLEDFDGNSYLDLFSGISVANAGHNNEAVVEAAREHGAWLDAELAALESEFETVGGYYGNVLRFQPPLSIERKDLERALRASRTALDVEMGETDA